MTPEELKETIRLYNLVNNKEPYFEVWGKCKARDFRRNKPKEK